MKTLEINELFVNFLGWTKHKGGEVDIPADIYCPKEIFELETGFWELKEYLIDIPFDNNWNYINKVIEQIERSKFGAYFVIKSDQVIVMCIQNNVVVFEYTKKCGILNLPTPITKILAVVDVCKNYIEWYNQQQEVIINILNS